MSHPNRSDDIEAVLDAPFYIEPIVGWRVWMVCGYGNCKCGQTDRGLLLRSLTYPMAWLRKRATRAHCMTCWYADGRFKGLSGAINHSPPDTAHGCGIYAVKRMQSARAWGEYSRGNVIVLGQVKIWGKILQYEDGYQAEYAYPVSALVPRNYGKMLSVPPEMSPEAIALGLAEAYDIEVGLGWPEST